MGILSDMKPLVATTAPVTEYFARLTPRQLEQALDSFADGRGYNLENLTCQFPADLHEIDQRPVESFDYIEFWSYSGNETARLSFNDFLAQLKAAILSGAAVQDRPRLLAGYERVRDRLRSLEENFRPYSEDD